MSKLKIHPHFNYPQEPGTVLWRYMDFTKFLALLEDSSLFMTRLDKFKDTFEGVITPFDKANRDTIYDQGLAEIMPHVDNINNLQRQRSYVNCWHINDYESAAMWSLYLKSNEGIAIRTTFQALSDSIVDETRVWIGAVDYIDYNSTPTPRGNLYYPMFLKRKSFEHEREVRVFYGENPNTYLAGKALPDKPKHDFGFNLKVDVNILINEIYVSPDSASWLYQLVKKVAGKYSITAAVTQSNLYTSPIL